MQAKQSVVYKILVKDREYKSYEIIDSFTLIAISNEVLTINPAECKLFNQDIFKHNELNNDVIIEHSVTRSMKNISGVLVLEGNKRYGKHKRKFLYKCIPDDKRIPIFMIPYVVNASFSKRQFNKYIVFKFQHWEDKYPRGSIVQMLGNVTELSNFYEYQLYCKSLYASIQNFSKRAMKKIKEKTEIEFIHHIQQTYDVEDRSTWDIITIDPLHSKDFDDAFGFKQISNRQICLSIYIANVSFWLDTLNLWGSFSERIATIYLPDRKRPMLPTILSDSLCSLQENRLRFAFTLDILLDSKTMEIQGTTFKNTCIKVRKNLRYDAPSLLKNTTYRSAFGLVNKMNKVNKYMEHIDNSHDLIAYLMILMNYLSATYLVSQKRGIFRSAKFNKMFVTPTSVPTEVQKFLKTWNSFKGKYVKYNNIEGHDMLQLDAYIHITSPIRRLVDLLNIMIVQDSLKLMKLDGSRKEFYDRWTNDESFEYINRTMRSIRKVQNDCNLLNMYAEDKTLLEHEYVGYIFDKIKRNDDLYQYMVYMPKIKMVNRFTSRHDKPSLAEYKFKIYIFTDESQLKRKIRIELQN